MAHIERRVRSGKVNYRARYRDPAGRERSKSFSRKVDAERWVAEIEHAKTRGAWTDPALGVIARGVVDTADRWAATEGGVGSVMVVSMDPGRQGTLGGGVGSI